MSQYRPQRATGKADANHWMVRDFLRDLCGGFEPHQEGDKTAYTANFRGYNVWAVDTHTIGGLFVDWIIGCRDSGKMLWVEIKTPEAYAKEGYSLRPGEVWAIDNLGICVVVSTDSHIAGLFTSLIPH